MLGAGWGFVAAACAAAVLAAGTASAHDDLVAVVEESFLLPVVDGPNRDQHVRIDVSVFTPETATPGSPAPVVLLAHGFGGDKDGSAGEARRIAHHGYIGVTYSARGFGASTGGVSVNGVHYDVQDVRQLIDAIAARPTVLLDGPGDPRLGMTGGSDGGGISLLAAAFDSRIDAIAPQATWASLLSSLAPNHLGPGLAIEAQPPGVVVRASRV